MINIKKIREESWGVGISYDTPTGFMEFIFEKEKILKEHKVKDIEELKKKEKELKEGGLEDMIKKKMFKSIVRGVKFQIEHD